MSTRKAEQKAEAQAIIAKLGLEPHPEGAQSDYPAIYFRETYRTAVKSEADRASATAIYCLLGPGGTSHWHRVDADELWLWHAGAPIDLLIAPTSGNGAASTVKLGPNVLEGEVPQALIAAGEWQAATGAEDAWTLVSCVVAPAFEFKGFELAAKGWAPGQ